MTKQQTYTSGNILMAGHELAAHLRQQGISDTAAALRWATERNAGSGFAVYPNDDAGANPVQAQFSDSDLFLVVGFALALSDTAFAAAYFGDED